MNNDDNLKIIRWTKSIHPSLIDEFICEIQKREFNLLFPEKFNFCLYDMKKYYQGNDGKINFFLAINNKNIIGTIGLRKLNIATCELRKFYIHLDHRKTGLGTRLFEVAMQAAKKDNYSKIYTGTMNVKVKAQKFYEKNKFKEINLESLPESFKIQALDEKFYCQILNI